MTSLPYWDSNVDMQIAPWFPLGVDYKPVSVNSHHSGRLSRIAALSMRLSSEFFCLTSLQSGYAGTLLRDSMFIPGKQRRIDFGFTMLFGYSAAMEEAVGALIESQGTSREESPSAPSGTGTSSSRASRPSSWSAEIPSSVRTNSWTGSASPWKKRVDRGEHAFLRREVRIPEVLYSLRDRQPRRPGDQPSSLRDGVRGNEEMGGAFAGSLLSAVPYP